MMEEETEAVPHEKEDTHVEESPVSHGDESAHVVSDMMPAAAVEEENADWDWEDLAAWDARLRQLAEEEQQRTSTASEWEDQLNARLEACIKKKMSRESSLMESCLESVESTTVRPFTSNSSAVES